MPAARTGLQRLGQRFVEGDEWAMILALKRCTQERRRLPLWLSDALDLRLTIVTERLVDSWDKVLPPVKPKGRKLSALRLAHEWTDFIVIAVYGAVKRGAAMEPSLFDELSEREGWPLSGGTARKFYYAAQKRTMSGEEGSPHLAELFRSIAEMQGTKRPKPRK